MTDVSRSRLVEGGWLLFWMAVSSVWCVSASAQLGATYDEPCYLKYGIEKWHSGSSRRLLELGTMPLPCHVQNLPVYVWEMWRGEAFEPVGDLARILPVARLGTLPFWWVLLVYSWLIGRRLGGVWGGRLAVALVACEPNLLAHASLATTDLPVTACLVAFFYHFRYGRDCGWQERVLLPSLWFAFAILSKASGFVFGGIGMLAIEFDHRLATETTATGWWPRLRTSIAALWKWSFRWDVFQIGTLGLVGAFWYCGSDWDVCPSFVAWAHDLPDGPLRSGMSWFAEHLRIFSNAGVALVRQVRHNVQGHGVFILDRVAQRAIWYYFPVALSIKSPLPILALPCLLVVVSPKTLRNWACWTALALLVFSLTCRVQTGIRFMLPLLALAVAGLAAALVTAREVLTARMGRSVLSGVGGLAVVWMMWSAASVWPDGLCFTNEAWGGTATGYQLLSDSNYDWGQGLKELARWQREHGVQDLDVMYYGTDPTLQKLPMRNLAPGNLILGPDGLPLGCQGRTVAVGTSLLCGSLGDDLKALKVLARELRARRPVDRTATFLIYRFPTHEKVASQRKKS
jgi:hypothetical protein